MLRCLSLFLSCLLCLPVVAGSFSLPDIALISGWRVDTPLTYRGHDMYGYMNGGAEIFLEFGCRSLQVQHYLRQDKKMTLELFVMDGPLAALGIFLNKFPGTPYRDGSEQTAVQPGQVGIAKGRCFVRVSQEHATQALQPVLKELAQALASLVPAESLTHPFALLPAENLVPGSGLLFRGKFGLEKLYYFGPGDILQLKGRVFGFAGTYKQDDQEVRKLVIAYPDEAAASSAFNHIAQNLDTYLTVVRHTDHDLVMRDYRDTFARVTRHGTRLNIVLDMTLDPLTLNK